MANGDIKQITLPQSSGGGTYNIVDQGARNLITALQGAMVFKGTIGDSKPTASYIWSELPVASEAQGFTYKVISDHSTTPICKNGDTIVSNGVEWVVIPSGDEPSGTVTSVGTGTGLTGGPITESGTISVNTEVIATKEYAATVGPVTSVAGKTGAVTLAKSDVGLGNVGNFKAVSTVASQGLNSTEQANARANIGAGTSSFSGSYTDLTNKPTIPTVNNATLTIQKNGSNVATFTANSSTNATANISVNEVPSGGTEGQILTKTSSGFGWANAAGGGTKIIVRATQPAARELPEGRFWYQIV